jgi:hypothetical protein
MDAPLRGRRVPDQGNLGERLKAAQGQMTPNRLAQLRRPLPRLDASVADHQAAARIAVARR